MTGPGAYAALDEIESRLRQAGDLLKTQPEHLARRIEQLLADREKLEGRIREMVERGGGNVAGQELEVRGVAVTVTETTAEDRDEVGRLADKFRAGKKNSALVLFGTTGPRRDPCGAHR